MNLRQIILTFCVLIIINTKVNSQNNYFKNEVWVCDENKGGAYNYCGTVFYLTENSLFMGNVRMNEFVKEDIKISGNDIIFSDGIKFGAYKKVSENEFVFETGGSSLLFKKIKNKNTLSSSEFTKLLLQKKWLFGAYEIEFSYNDNKTIYLDQNCKVKNQITDVVTNQTWSVLEYKKRLIFTVSFDEKENFKIFEIKTINQNTIEVIPVSPKSFNSVALLSFKAIEN